MKKYYTRVCNFFYGDTSKNLVKNKKTLILNGNKKLSFNYIEILSRNTKKKIHIDKLKTLPEIIQKKISDDFFITAAHCLSDNLSTSVISSMEIIISREFENASAIQMKLGISEIYFVNDKIYKLATSSKARAIYKAQSNDMVIFKVIGDEAALKSIPNATWDRDEITRLSGVEDFDKEKLYISGYGLTEDHTISYVLRGYTPHSFERLPSDILRFKARKKQHFDSGDSGGGLWLKTENANDNFLLGICYGSEPSFVTFIANLPRANTNMPTDLSKCASLEKKGKWISDVLSSKVEPHWKASWY